MNGFSADIRAPSDKLQIGLLVRKINSVEQVPMGARSIDKEMPSRIIKLMGCNIGAAGRGKKEDQDKNPEAMIEHR